MLSHNEQHEAEMATDLLHAIDVAPGRLEFPEAPCRPRRRARRRSKGLAKRLPFLWRAGSGLSSRRPVMTPAVLRPSLLINIARNVRRATNRRPVRIQNGWADRMPASGIVFGSSAPISAIDKSLTECSFDARDAAEIGGKRL